MKRGISNLDNPYNNPKNASQDLMSLSLFAHIFNDLDLSGSPLEGNYLFDTIAYFDDFIHRLLNNEIPDAFSTEILENLRNQANEIRAIFSSLTYIAAQISRKRIENLKYTHNIDALSASFDDIVDILITQLKEQKRVYIPGGWRGAPTYL